MFPFFGSCCILSTGLPGTSWWLIIAGVGVQLGRQLYRRRKKLGENTGAIQLRMEPGGFSVRSGYGPADLAPWSAAKQIQLRKESPTLFKVVIKRGYHVEDTEIEIDGDAAVLEQFQRRVSDMAGQAVVVIGVK